MLNIDQLRGLNVLSALWFFLAYLKSLGDSRERGFLKVLIAIEISFSRI